MAVKVMCLYSRCCPKLDCSTSVVILNKVTRPFGRARFYSAPSDKSIPLKKQKYVPSSGTYPKGFLASGAHVGVKPSNTIHDDFALIVSTSPCAAAAVFTKNRFQAAPVTVGKEILGSGLSSDSIRAVAINSGCANAVTGKQGLEDARAMAAETDKCLSGGNETKNEKLSTIPMSTGVIGQRLPISKIVAKIPSAASSLGTSHQDWMAAATAICTTDTFPKLLSRQFSLPSFSNQKFAIAGMVKGAGMIHPNMGTLLGVVCTDVPIEHETLRNSLARAIQVSFNSISIDGDTSTNDTIALLANGAGASEDQKMKGLILSDKDKSNTANDCEVFNKVLETLLTDLSHLVVRDGEGATKFVTIRMRGYKSPENAKAIASTVARSPLVKTALYGKDANWGRILCAVGYTDPAHMDGVDLTKVSVSFLSSNQPEGKGNLNLLVKGEPQEVDETHAAKLLALEDLEILIDLGMDSGPDTAAEDLLYWTCDFSHEYVTINGDYRT